MDPLVSIIVPVYNVEPYLDRCVDSIINQSYRQLEIILVDDGSPDHCGQMCDGYAERDSRIKVIHQKNAGLSAARNAGLDAAHGEYVYFADSDDWLEPALAEENVALMQEYDADMIVFGYYDEWIGRQEKIKGWDKTYDTQTIKEKLLSGEGMKVVWNKMYKRRLYDNVRFPVGCNMEDTYVLGEVLFNASRIICHDHCLYHYFKGNNASITKRDNIKRLFDLYHAYERLAFWAPQITMNAAVISQVVNTAVRYALKAYNVNLIKRELSRNDVDKIESYLQNIGEGRNFTSGGVVNCCGGAYCII